MGRRTKLVFYYPNCYGGYSIILSGRALDTTSRVPRTDDSRPRRVMFDEDDGQVMDAGLRRFVSVDLPRAWWRRNWNESDRWTVCFGWSKKWSRFCGWAGLGGKLQEGGGVVHTFNEVDYFTRIGANFRGGCVQRGVVGTVPAWLF